MLIIEMVPNSLIFCLKPLNPRLKLNSLLCALLKTTRSNVVLKEQDQGQGQYMFIPGATTIGVVCSDGVVLASEKRVSYGYMIMSRGGKKVFKVTDRIGAACAGLVSHMRLLIREVEAYANLFRLDAN